MKQWEKQPFTDKFGVEVSTEGDFDCVQNKKAKKEVICSLNNDRGSKLKNVIYLFLAGALSQAYT